METLNYTKENFHQISRGIFSECETPQTTPDYVSLTKNGRVSSQYWFTENGVVRNSDHWGQIASCIWILKGFSKKWNDCEVSKNAKTGYCSFDNFNKTTSDFQEVVNEYYSKLNVELEILVSEKQYSNYSEASNTKNGKVISANYKENLIKLFEL